MKPKAMRIGIDARVLFGPHTGDRTYLLNLLRQFAQMDLTHEFVLFSDRWGNLPFDLPPNFRPVLLPKISSRLYTALLLPRACSAYRVDLLHVQYIAPLFASCPIVTTVHDVHWRRFPETFPIKDRLLMEIFLPLTFRKASAVITDSKASRDDLMRFFRVPPSKLRVIYLAAEEQFFVRLSKSQQQVVLNRYGLTEGYLLFVGVIQPRKNLERLLHAFALLRPKVECQPLVIVGKIGWKTQRLLHLVNELGLKDCVKFTGYVPDEDLPAIYQGAKVFAYPALWEGFGLPVLEAMASGVPVLTSATSSLIEIAENAALLVDPLSVRGIFEGLHQLLVDEKLREELRQKGCERAQQFSWLKTAQETLQVYEQVAIS
ncbi:MAG: glycosyltransferase family 4 protein [Armatimonadetes bacterium]|nr:glycosyltransferase family 4 protein [Armatimonadota bacterium]